MHRTSIVLFFFSFLTVLQSVAAQQTFDDHFRGRKQGQGASSTSQAAAQTSAAAGSNGANGANANGNANSGNNGNNGNNNAATGGANGLNAQLVQKASQSDGNPTDGQAPSDTDPQNFINFCQGKNAITNGQQIKGGSCNGIVMGDIPSTNNMISAIITNPKVGEVVPPNQAFAVQVQVQNLEAGSFTNPDNTYYAAPQQLKNGNVIGHCHVVIQKLQTLNDQTPPDPTTFAFFKGINDDGNGQGGLQAQVPSGLPAGNYRVCTMMGTSNHQPPLMPVAQRGAQDDCTKFTVGNTNNANNGNANNGNANSGSTNGNTAAANKGNGQATATTTSAAVQQTSASANNGQRGGKDRQGGSSSTGIATSVRNGASASAGGNQVQGTATTTAATSQQTGSGRGGRGQGQRFAARAAYVVRPDAPVPRFMAREFIV